ncbi:MFS transporter [Gallaecimonas xiamenensis]|uniref:MFS family transporter protein n=1 Tax=Gallaecimonas xiamenensis 3-C-1 TaxID=745411 RepID=K2JR67_9GAMM|nr:MFS transporter [Gallaecimonas xiamenensis]EKE77843.1 MFS family transporter protein [Gallaecimonas xiamenensis 3-C-1]
MFSRPVLLLLLGLLLLTISIAVQNTLVPLWLTKAQVSTAGIGTVTSLYFVGNLVGTLLAGRLISRLGFALSYQLVCLVFVLAVSGLWLTQSLWGWLGWRFLAGVACACIWVVVESWLMLKGDATQRSQLLAAYMVVYYLGTVVGQMLLSVTNTEMTAVLVWVGALIGVAMVPVALAGSQGAKPLHNPSPLLAMLRLKSARSGVIGCVLAGVVLGSLYGLLPVFLARQHFDDAQVGRWMAVLVAAGIMGQWPTGRLADRFGRRPVLLGQMAVMTLAALWLSVMGSRHGFALSLVGLGVVAFTLYPVAMAWACEQVSSDQLVAMNQALLLSYCLGSLAGPALAAVLMDNLSDSGLFMLIAATTSLVGFWCWRQRPLLTAL